MLSTKARRTSLVLLLVVFVGTCDGICPIGCLCLDDQQAPSVDCQGANLNSVPILLNPRIRKLSLANNRIAAITVDELSIYGELEVLDLSGNKIQNIERGAFFRLQKLQHLRLNANVLETLSVETFLGLSQLKTLDLSENSLNRLATSVFSDLRRLEVLNVSFNGIAHLSPGAFTGLSSLKDLHMQNNELSEVPKVALHAPRALKSLDFRYNRLRTIGDESFLHLPELEILDLTGNRLEEIDERAFAGLRGLRDLRLDSNRLRRVPTLSFRQLTELQSLNMSENLLTELPTSAFEGLSRLRELRITRCPQLRSVALNAFSGLYRLETLFLSENPALSDVDPMAFELQRRHDADVVVVAAANNVDVTDGLSWPDSDSDSDALETTRFGRTSSSSDVDVDVDNDNDNDNDDDVRPSKWSLRQVYLYANNLTQLPETLLPWRQLEELDLRLNPWLCDCGFAWIGRVLRQVYGRRQEYPDGAYCAQPSELKDRPLQALLEDGAEFDWCADSWTRNKTYVATMIGSLLACLSACLLALTVYLRCCRRRRRGQLRPVVSSSSSSDHHYRSGGGGCGCLCNNSYCCWEDDDDYDQDYDDRGHRRHPSTPTKPPPPPPPGLPQLYRFANSNLDNRSFYVDVGYPDDRYRQTGVGTATNNNGHDWRYDQAADLYRGSRSAYGKYVLPDEQASFLPQTTLGQYAHTSDYYSGFDSESGSPSQISPRTPPPPAAVGGAPRQSSFRIIQRYPIPITEL